MNSPYGPPPSQNPYGATPPPGASPYGAPGPGANPYAAPVASGQAYGGYGPSPYGDMEQLPLADRGTRFLGALLDGLIMMVVVLPVVFLGGAMDNPEDLANIYAYMAGPWLLISGIQWYLIATTGQSIGKKALGMKIVKMDGSDVNFVSGVIMRNWIMGLLGMIPLAGGIIGLIDPLMIFGDERRCLHDKIAGTQVISV